MNVFTKILESWGHLSTIIQEERESGTLLLTKALADWCIRKLQISTVGCLIGVNGYPSLVGVTLEEFERSWLQSGGNVHESEFVLQM